MSHKERVSSPLGDYLSANGYFDEFRWTKLSLEAYELPELFLLPIVKINDSHLHRSKPYEDAFTFLYNRKRFAFSGSHGAEILNLNGGDIWVFKNKKAYNVPYKPDSALSRINRLISSPLLASAQDNYDYISAAVWLSCLTNALSQTTQDLMADVNNAVNFYQHINQWSNLYTAQMDDIELHDVDLNIQFINAFLGMAYFKLYQSNGDEKIKRWAALSGVFFELSALTRTKLLR